MDKGWERLFWLVFERTSNPIVLLDDHRRVVAVNSAGAELWGRTRSDLEGLSIEETIVPSERPAAEAEWRSFLRSGDYSGRRDLIRPDGSTAHIRFAARLADVSGRRLALYVAVADDGNAEVTPSGEGGSMPLTERERQVVTLIALGYDTRGIAEKLHISTETVRTHVRNAMEKLEAHTRAQLVAKVICHGDALDLSTVSPS